MDKKEAEKKIHEAAKTGRIEFCATDEIKPYEEIILDFLHRIAGIKAAFISDESTLSDFSFSETDRLRAYKLYGLTLTGRERLIDVGRMLMRQTP